MTGSIHPYPTTVDVDTTNVYCCKTHYIAEFLPTCIGCNQAIVGNAIAIFGQQYHRECITCVECNSSAVDTTTNQVKGRKIANAVPAGEVEGTAAEGANMSTTNTAAAAAATTTTTTTPNSAIRSWLVCNEHQAPSDLSQECLEKIHLKYLSIELAEQTKQKKTVARLTLLEQRTKRLQQSALVIQRKEKQKETMENEIAMFYSSGGVRRGSGGGGCNDGEEGAKVKEAHLSQMPVDWMAETDEDGHVYYHNTSTGQATWNRPKVVER
jgi:hypothetical protein